MKQGHHGAHNSDGSLESESDGDSPKKCHRRRSDYIELRDIYRIKKEIDAEHINFHPDDGQSVCDWAEKLHAKKSLLGFKAKSDPAPPGSDHPGTFFLTVQTPGSARSAVAVTLLRK